MEKNLNIYTYSKKPSNKEKELIVKFLFENLEQFGDPERDILKAVDYALNEYHSFGGMILTTKIDNELVGVAVINYTGMKWYIPENILVYIATHKKYRGKGIGKFLMQKAIEMTDGDIALHVEPDNPARFLYEKVGFTSKYLEMRYKKGVD
ncbi:MAG: GNAT family N-acetyltransferase [Candidatus Cloacimonetes bacterium]|nr:GNAT family N-acetyltransferase [Candidatus Cloacimonadota bacterium]